MPRLASTRLVSQLQRQTEEMFYGEEVIYYAPPDAETDLDEYGQPSENDDGVTVACSFNDKPSKEKWGSAMDIQNIAGEIRLSSPQPDKGGRFQITGRWDEADSNPHVFDIVDIRQRGTFGYECLLKAVKI